MRITTARSGARRPSAPLPGKPPYLRCPTCGHVDRTQFWLGRNWKCITRTCEAGEERLIPADLAEFRAYMNREDEQPV